MARYTRNTSEVDHLISTHQVLQETLQKGFLIKVTLVDSTEYEGYLEQINVGNNAKVTRPPNSYYGEITLRLLSGEPSGSIDLLNVKSIQQP